MKRVQRRSCARHARIWTVCAVRSSALPPFHVLAGSHAVIGRPKMCTVTISAAFTSAAATRTTARGLTHLRAREDGEAADQLFYLGTPTSFAGNRSLTFFPLLFRNGREHLETVIALWAMEFIPRHISSPLVVISSMRARAARTHQQDDRYL